MVGMILADGRALLEQAGFEVSVEEDAIVAGGRREPCVRQDPEAGARGAKGSAVVLTVSLGAPEEVEVPLLLGLRIEEARAALEARGCGH